MTELITCDLRNIDLFKLLKITCVRCNIKPCICPTTKETQKTISNIKETHVKRDKWITQIYGDVELDTFLFLKSELGTGGKFEKDYLYLRGKVALRAKKILLKRGFQILGN